jgi:hypothetical protein
VTVSSFYFQQRVEVIPSSRTNAASGWTDSGVPEGFDHFLAWKSKDRRRMGEAFLSPFLLKRLTPARRFAFHRLANAFPALAYGFHG